MSQLIIKRNVLATVLYLATKLPQEMALALPQSPKIPMASGGHAPAGQ